MKEKININVTDKDIKETFENLFEQPELLKMFLQSAVIPQELSSAFHIFVKQADISIIKKINNDLSNHNKESKISEVVSSVADFILREILIMFIKNPDKISFLSDLSSVKNEVKEADNNLESITISMLEAIGDVELLSKFKGMNKKRKRKFIDDLSDKLKTHL